MDFTITKYRILLNTLQKQGFSFQPFEEYCSNPQDRVIILRHDVDLLPYNSLQFARIQAEMGIKGTYYFRIVPESFDEKIIKEIYSLGHEVGYHYEELGTTAQRHKGVKARVGDGEKRREGDENEKVLVDLAIESFRKNLEKLRNFAPVSTICMHGSPMSKWDSRLLWKYYDYRDFGIAGEPYFDINFDEVLYLTDTGRRWDGGAFNVRDKAPDSYREGVQPSQRYGWQVRSQAGGGRRDGVTEGRRDGETKGRRDGETIRRRIEIPQFGNPIPQTASRTPFPKFHSTFDIIKAAESGHFPDKIMMTFHPQRWTDKPIPWVKELVCQNVKNQVKYLLVLVRNE